MEMNGEFFAVLRSKALDVLREIPHFSQEVELTLVGAGPTGEPIEFFWFAIWGLAFMAVGLIVRYMIHKWAYRQFAHFFQDAPQNRADKISFLWFRGSMQALSVLGAFITAAAITFMVNGDTPAIWITQLSVISWFCSCLLTHYVFFNLAGIDVPAYRMLPMGDREALSFYRDFVYIIYFVLSIAFICLWMSEIGLQHETHILLLMMGSLATAVVMSGLVLYRAKPIGNFISRNSSGGKAGSLLQIFGRIWHIVAIAYFIASLLKVTVNLLLDQPTGVFLALMPFAFGYIGLAVYGLFLLIIDRLAEKNHVMVSLPSDHDIEDQDIQEMSAPVPLKSMKTLFEKGAFFLVLAMWFSAMSWAWGTNIVSSQSMVVEFSDILVVLFLSYMAYQAVKIFIDNKMAEEGGFDEPEPGDEGGSSGSASRLATLLPMFRNALLITILVISGMILLSRIGVDVAPLFAGAGVIGLAVGFGAQTLIRDIFSGAFFLIDDAFRKGEYINLGSVKGTVEKISIRSLQLRHHLGALHTIPFGEIQHLTNYSRDWVMMKLTLRVTYDTDVEKVRKLIKNLGKELLNHPEVGENFLQPLKSQGVYKMEDSAMILRVKFMTKPGEQFVARKLVYSRIRELFAAEGIKFAHREVTVRLAGEDGESTDPNHLSTHDKKAIAGAALPDESEVPAGSS